LYMTDAEIRKPPLPIAGPVNYLDS
jgi:hypothetical protein